MPGRLRRPDALLPDFRTATLKHPQGGRGAWAQLPPEFGKAGTASHAFRRWAKGGLWQRLLRLVPDKHGARTPVVAAPRHRACCAFRRADRFPGLRGGVLARRLGLHSALPAPSHCPPELDLSEIYMPAAERALRRSLDGLALADPGPAWRPPRRAWVLFRQMHGFAGGRARINRAVEPP